MNSFIDYYSVLGVDSNAAPDEVKAAFKKLALQYHPDVYKGEDAQERMRLLLQAYKTLNDATARKQYNARRSEHIDETPRVQYEHSERTSPTTSTSNAGARSHASSGARRDRQRHYDFPDFPPGQSVHVNLVDIAYDLSPFESRSLVQEGMLRGLAPKNQDHAYYCHRCHHHWHSGNPQSHEMPRYCPKCQAVDWPEYLLLRCLHCRAVFESEQIRYEIGTHTYGDGDHAGLCPPYELFPLCPYCGTARWSPAEDARVGELRLRVARRNARFRILFVVVALAVVIIIGALALEMLQ